MVNLCSWEQSREQKSQALVLFWNTSTLPKILQERRGQCHLLTMPWVMSFLPTATATGTQAPLEWPHDPGVREKRAQGGAIGASHLQSLCFVGLLWDKL